MQPMRVKKLFDVNYFMLALPRVEWFLDDLYACEDLICYTTVKVTIIAMPIVGWNV